MEETERLPELVADDGDIVALEPADAQPEYLEALYNMGLALTALREDIAAAE